MHLMLSITERQILTEPALQGVPIGTKVSVQRIRRSFKERFGEPRSEALFFKAMQRLAEFGFLKSDERQRGDRRYIIEADWSTAAAQAVNDALAATVDNVVYHTITAAERAALAARETATNVEPVTSSVTQADNLGIMAGLGARWQPR